MMIDFAKLPARQKARKAWKAHVIAIVQSFLFVGAILMVGFFPELDEQNETKYEQSHQR
ncbi:MAG: hypothetical protein SVC26_06420 [Pseudomonadota bacterium]|nr:hypothetical protein [Pseudomonadota bacterium]